jgi:hypothetical protein
MKHPPIRRKGTRRQHTRWTPEALALIDAYQAQHHLPSFSAAAETLVRLGLQQSPAEIITPIIASAVREAVHRELDRLIRVQIYTAIEVGMTYRFAAATARDVGRLKDDPPERYQRLKAFVRSDTRRRIAQGQIGRLLNDLVQTLATGDDARSTDDLMGALMGDEGEVDDGDHPRELSRAGTEDGDGRDTGGALLHVS